MQVHFGRIEQVSFHSRRQVGVLSIVGDAVGEMRHELEDDLKGNELGVVASFSHDLVLSYALEKEDVLPALHYLVKKLSLVTAKSDGAEVLFFKEDVANS